MLLARTNYYGPKITENHCFVKPCGRQKSVALRQAGQAKGEKESFLPDKGVPRRKNGRFSFCVVFSAGEKWYASQERRSSLWIK